MMEDLTKEQIELLTQEKNELFIKCTEILETKSYVEGINGVCEALDNSLIAKLDSREDLFYNPLVESLLEWLHDRIQNTESPEEREMRINQAIFICFLLYTLWETVCFRCFKQYIAPFIIGPHFRTKQIVQTLQQRFYDITHSEEAKDIDRELRTTVMEITVKEDRCDPKRIVIY